MTLKQIRKRAGLTAREVGAKVGVSCQNVYNWESGSYPPPTNRLLPLAELYGCTVDDLVKASQNSA